MRASDFTVKKRDPNWKTLQAKRTSNAAGAHKDKKKAAKQGDVKHKSKETVEEGVSYGTMPADALRTLLHVYEKESQGVQQHQDAEGAARISHALNDAAKELGVGRELKSLYNAASHSAHQDFDTNPGDFKNWFTYVGDLLQGLYKIHQEKGSYDNDEPDTHPDEGVEEAGYNHGYADPNAPNLGSDRDFRNQERNAGLEDEDYGTYSIWTQGSKDDKPKKIVTKQTSMNDAERHAKNIKKKYPFLKVWMQAHHLGKTGFFPIA